jgi:hypothetical protein
LGIACSVGRRGWNAFAAQTKKVSRVTAQDREESPRGAFAPTIRQKIAEGAELHHSHGASSMQHPSETSGGLLQ